MSDFDGITFRNIRLVESECFDQYVSNTKLWGDINDIEFALHVEKSSNDQNSNNNESNDKSGSWRVYHAWLPGAIQSTAQQASVIRDLINTPPTDSLTPEQQPFVNRLRQLGWLDDNPADIEDLVKRSQEQIIAIQNKYEITEFLKIVQNKAPRVIVEIGTARGGMLNCFCQLATPDALIISIDLPGGPFCGGQTPVERQFYSSFAGPQQSLNFIPQNSHLDDTKEKLRDLLSGNKIDLLFIDGDHTYDGVKQDYDMYSEFLASDGLLAFHDILLVPEHWGEDIAVGAFWNEVSTDQEAIEIVDPDGMCKPVMPPGISKAWGIGLIGKGIA